MEVFALFFLTSILATWYTTIVKKDYVVFTDEATVPAPTDFLGRLLGIEPAADEEE